MNALNDLIWNDEEMPGDELDLCSEDGPPMIIPCQIDYVTCHGLGGGDNPDPFTVGSYQGSNQCGC